MARGTRLLLIGFAQADLQLILASLERLGLLVHHFPWCDETLELVSEQHYDVVMARSPTVEPSLARFLSAVRAPAGPSRHCGLILVVDADSEHRARQLVGHGVSRVVTVDTSPQGLSDVVVELLEVAPRYPLRFSTRVLLDEAARPVTSLGQTVNISASGMLVAGIASFPLGALLSFELDLPGSDQPLRGTARITRRANPSREGIEGFGARFTAFQGTGRSRLEGVLSSLQA